MAEYTTSQTFTTVSNGLSMFGTTMTNSLDDRYQGNLSNGQSSNFSTVGQDVGEIRLSTSSNYDNGSVSNLTYKLDPQYYPAFYDVKKCQTLNYTVDPLYNCEIAWQAFIFGVFVFSVGFLAIFGNAVMPIVVWKRRSMRTKQNYIKVSLAFNDMITGFLLLGSVLPNVIWFRNSTEYEAMAGMRRTYDSPAASIGGSALIITLQGSLFHLMYLSADRYFAIKWPIRNRRRKRSTVVWTCIGIWLLTLVGSAITVSLQKYFNFLYNPMVFMYTVGYEKAVLSGLHGYLHFALALFLPYIATIILTVLTGIWACRQLTSSSTKLYRRATRVGSVTENGISSCSDAPMVRDDSRRSEKTRRPQLALVKTIMIMTGAFAIAWSIFFVMFFVSIRDHALSIMYLLSFSSGWTNSVANVIIYSLKDNSFRAAVKATFFSKSKMNRGNGSTTVRRAADFSTRSFDDRRSSIL